MICNPFRPHAKKKTPSIHLKKFSHYRYNHEQQYRKMESDKRSRELRVVDASDKKDEKASSVETCGWYESITAVEITTAEE